MKRFAGHVPTRWIVLGIVACAVIASIGTTAFKRITEREVTAYFPNTVGLYVGDTVRVLGVEVGTITGIEPQPDAVKVSMVYDRDIKIPERAQAAIIAPTLVTGRYVQLSPPYDGGPVLADGASIPLQRTAIPMSYDEIKTQLNALAKQLGPRELNRDGSVNRFVTESARALKTSSDQFAPSITELSRLADTLSRGGPDMFTTIRNLAAFVDALSASTDQVSGFNTQLAGVSSVLAANRSELDSLLKTLAATVIRVQSVVEQNRASIKGNVAAFQNVTGLLKRRQDALAQTLHAAPTALANLYNIYDPGSNSLTGNLAIPDLPDPYSLICALLTTVNAPQEQCQKAGGTFLDQLTRSIGAPRGRAPARPRSLADLLHPAPPTRGGR